jgi:hypothetical protein
MRNSSPSMLQGKPLRSVRPAGAVGQHLCPKGILLDARLETMIRVCLGYAYLRSRMNKVILERLKFLIDGHIRTGSFMVGEVHGWQVG